MCEFSDEEDHKDDYIRELSYSKYILNGGRFSKEDFQKVLKYEPTDIDMREVTRYFPNMPIEDKIIVAKIYHVMSISSKRILLINNDIELHCEYLAFTGRLMSIKI